MLLTPAFHHSFVLEPQGTAVSAAATGSCSSETSVVSSADDLLADPGHLTVSVSSTPLMGHLAPVVASTTGFAVFEMKV